MTQAADAMLLHPVATFIGYYQTLLVGLIAVSIAFLQMKIAQNQHEISKRQIAMAEEQQRQARAIALLAIDPVIDDLMQIEHEIMQRCVHADGGGMVDGKMQWSLHPTALTVFDAHPMEWNDAEVLENVVKMFPERAPEVRDMLKAARDLKRLADLYLEKPWYPALNEMGQKELQARGSEDIELDQTFTRFWHLVSSVRSIQARHRTA